MFILALITKLLLTLLAGMASVLSPCFLPVLPGFISYLSGLSLKEAKDRYHRKELIINCLLFSFGFCLVFATFGFSMGMIGKFLVINQLVLTQIGGLLLLFFGLIQTELLKIKPLLKTFRFSTTSKNSPFSHGQYQSLIVGMIFAFSWSPCYGPIIGGIFTLAATSTTMLEAVGYFVIYSLGFTIPILLIGIFFDQVSNLLVRYRRIFLTVNLLAGIIMIVIGILMLTNSLGNIVNWLDLIYTNNKLLFY